MGIIQVLQEKFDEIYEREGEDHAELTDEEAEAIQTAVFTNTGMHLVFSDVKKLFKAFLDRDLAKRNRPKRRRGKNTNQACII